MIDRQTRAAAATVFLSVEELLRFERLLSELSAGFINLPAERIDDAIDDGLRRIVEALGIDRSTLNSLSPATGRFEVTHSFAVEGVAPLPKLMSARDTSPWALAMVSANKPVVFSRLDDLPPEAGVDRATYQRIGLKSHVTMPVIVGGQLHGGLSFGCVRRERTWPDELLGRMRLLAEIFGNALARKRAQEELDRAVGFERLATGVLASLLIARPGDEDRAIELGLREIGLFLGVEQATLWQRHPGRDEFRKTHRWLVEDAAVPTWFAPVDLPWISARLIDGSVVQFARHAELPPEAAADLPTLDALGARSLLAVPYSVAGEIAGALFFANMHADRDWPDGIIPGVRLLAEVFASLHARRSTEHRKHAAEAEAAHWRERLAHLVRVHTVGEMSAALAHEISQPLVAIENYALAARRRAAEESDPKKVAELLDKVVAQTSRAGDVIKRLRGMVKRHDTETKSIDVERAVGECVEMVKVDCELRDIRLELALTVGLPAVAADEIQIQQVILNLLRNAMEAMALARADRPRVIAIETSFTAEEGVSVRVADRGSGIAEGDLERVFEAFYSTKATGLGVGLAICRKLIEAHGGTLQAFHNPGGGAVFRFTLPVTES